MDWKSRNIAIQQLWIGSCMEWFFMGSGRLWHKYDSDITRWNYMDWKRNIDILKLWIWSCVEWVFMGSGRCWHKFDSDISGWNYMDRKNRNIDILN